MLLNSTIRMPLCSPRGEYKLTGLCTIQWHKAHACKDQDRHRGDICAKKETKEIICEKIHIDLAHQIKGSEAILVEKEIDCSPPCSQELPQEIFTEVVLMAALGIRRCHGCKREILKQNCLPPKDLVFWMQALQIWRTKG